MTLPVGSESLQAGGHIGHPGSATYKYLRCYGGGGHGGGRSCLERIIFRLGNSDILITFMKFIFYKAVTKQDRPKICLAGPKTVSVLTACS